MTHRTRAAIPPNQIALLATGDEISNGDIFNSNTPEIAQKLFAQGLSVGMHMVTRDTITDIERAIQFLLQTHRAVIITGGLGPTSDDLTRYALANATQRALVFNEASWHHIVERLRHLGYTTPPQNNRQQALFPEGAMIIPNPNGTAAGCLLQLDQQFIFMLPGPPMECLPMVETNVLPALIKHDFKHILYHEKWLLFGVSEGHIAEQLDAAARPFECITGYRLCYPYIEFKLYSNNESDFLKLAPPIKQIISPYLIENGKKTASALLQEKLLTLKNPIEICDRATGGLLESTIRTPLTEPYLSFFTNSKKSTIDLRVTIKGLNNFWKDQKAETKTSLTIIIKHKKTKKIIENTIPFRGNRVKQYAVEFICWRLYELITTNEIAAN